MLGERRGGSTSVSLIPYYVYVFFDNWMIICFFNFKLKLSLECSKRNAGREEREGVVAEIFHDCTSVTLSFG